MAAAPGEITHILDDLTAGNGSAANRLMPLVYDELKTLAASFFRRQEPGHTLQPTALVHEAYVRLVGQPGQPGQQWTGRDHFFAVAAMAMRQVLVDHARRRRRSKRGGDRARVTLDESLSPSVGPVVDFVELNDALEKLAALDERKCRVVTFRFFGGLTNEAIGSVLGVSRMTVVNDWRVARAWLGDALAGARPA